MVCFPEELERNIETLGELVKAGKLVITYVVGPPRSVTTTLAGAIGHSADVGIDNVFHERFSQHGTMQEIRERLNDPAAKKPVHIVIKEMPDDYADPALAAISQHVIVTCREPLQLALANTLDKRLADEMQDVSLTHLSRKKHSKIDEETMKNIAVMTSGLHNVSKDLGLTRDFIQSVRELDPPVTMSFVDGDMFRGDPETTLQTLCERSGIRYSKKMVENWTRTHDVCDAWTRQYENSNRILKPVQQTPASEALFLIRGEPFSKELKDYQELVCSPEMVKPDFVHLIHKTFHTACGKEGEQPFEELLPLTACVFAASYEDLPPELAAQQKAYLAKMENIYRHEHQSALKDLQAGKEAPRKPGIRVREAEPVLTKDRPVVAR